MKKKKKTLTKQQRNAILQSLQRSNSIVIIPNKTEGVDVDKTENNLPQSDNDKENTRDFIDELKRIALVGGVVVILLVVTVVTNKKTDYLIKAGSYITHKIGL